MPALMVISDAVIAIFPPLLVSAEFEVKTPPSLSKSALKTM